MKTEHKIIIVIGLFFLSLVTIVYLHSKNSECKKQVEVERLKQDSLMGAKQQSDKELFHLNKKFIALKEQNEKLEKQLTKSGKK